MMERVVTGGADDGPGYAGPGHGGSSAYYSAIAEGYDDSYALPGHRRVYDDLARRHAFALPLPAGARVIDAGCGTGRWLPEWLARGCV
ncbi:MAG: hypothetical protein INR65_13135, partial [Gluconacetobacter diazotrophicus]|nr:hypothetical protein [Gluconacetobacter diazotrophicus]